MGHKDAVLVVDDDSVTREILCAALVEAGYVVEVAADGREALSKLRSFPADVVLADLNMPGMTGLELIQALGRRGAAMPVVILTGAETMSLRTDPAAFGAAGCLRKPVQLDELLWALDRAAACRSAPAHVAVAAR